MYMYLNVMSIVVIVTANKLSLLLINGIFVTLWVRELIGSDAVYTFIVPTYRHFSIGKIRLIYNITVHKVGNNLPHTTPHKKLRILNMCK